MTTWALHTLPDPDGLEPLKVIIPGDGTRGLIVGDDTEVKALAALLNAYLATGQTAGEISRHDYQLGYKWLTVPEAVAMADGLGHTANGRTIRWACKNGYIPGALKEGADWRFSKTDFLAWLNDGSRKPGRRPKTDPDDPIHERRYPVKYGGK